MENYKKRIFKPLLIATILLCSSMLWLFIAMYQMIYFSEQKDLLDQQRYGLVALAQAITDAESGQRGYLMTGHTPFLDTMESGRAATLMLFKKLGQSAALYPNFSEGLIQLNRTLQQKFAILDKNIQVQLNAGSYASHLSLTKDKGSLLMLEIKQKIHALDDVLVKHRQKLETEIRQRIIESVLGGIVLVLVIVGTLIFSYQNTLRLFEQLSENQAVAKKFSHQAEHDLLTGLPNRRSIEAYLQQTFMQARMQSAKFSVLFMDLDNFKQVNDEYGHEMGDALLIEVANRIKKSLRQSDFFARMGGDEFILIATQYQHQNELAQLAQRLISMFDQPVVIKDKSLSIGLSIGIAEYPTSGKNVTQLMHAADKAMYTSKKHGKNRYSFFSA